MLFLPERSALLMEIFTGIFGDVEQKSVRTRHGESTHGQHLSDEDVAAFVDNRVLARKRRMILLHLVNCEKCRKTVSEVTLSQSVVSNPDEPQQ
jgi:hypothetical protein